MWDDPESQAILAAAPINCPSCGEFISQFIHPEQDCSQVTDITDALWDILINFDDGAPHMFTDEANKTIKDACQEIRLLREAVRTFTDGRPWGDCVSVRRSSFGFVRFSNPEKVAVIQRAYDEEGR
jgi:hypothetical protein